MQHGRRAPEIRGKRRDNHGERQTEQEEEQTHAGPGEGGDVPRFRIISLGFASVIALCDSSSVAVSSSLVVCQ